MTSDAQSIGNSMRVWAQATADCLRELGVQWMQGYLHARPRPLAEMLAEAG